MAFRSIYGHGFLRVAACTVETAIAEPARNAEAILAVAAAVSCRCRRGRGLSRTVAVGLCARGPVPAADPARGRRDGARRDRRGLARSPAGARRRSAPAPPPPALQHSGVVIHRGAVLGVVPKSYLPNYREFYEKRHFAAGAGVNGAAISAGAAEAPFGTDLLFAADDLPGFVLGVEICEDMWVPVPPAGALAQAGGDGSRQPVGQPHHDRPSAEPRTPLPVHIGPLPRRLCLCGRGCGRIHHRPQLGRTDGHLRERREAGRRRALRRRGADYDRRHRPRPPAPGTDLDGFLRRQCAGDGGRELPHRVVPSRPAGGRRRVPPRHRTISLRAERPANASPRIATRPTTSRWRGLQQRLSAIGVKRITIGGVGRGSIPPMRSSWPSRPSTGSAWRGATSWPIRCRASPPATIPRPMPTG